MMVAAAVFAASCVSLLAPACATDQIYRPTSPTFGGNPLNGTFLLSTAQAQGYGAKSGQNSPDLSGLNQALSNLGNSGSVATPTIIINGTGIPANP
ncbi:curli assembly protein CsgF [Methylobacterium aerolatum]|uniref:Curli production assembly/transport component CsgF n=1 Tax=Methylobacterium aerolatum TaxID=418708 RepID=A0ABU0HUU1_9HYPH|nr:curli assembly protein CsgF [Methylobacterium aerolatum]MDQ0446093.1 curli production assembly/transport component CsgF [Methylobacterium aerolatum]